MDILLDLSLKIAAAAVTAFFAAYVTVRLSLRRFYSEKWCEKNADAYSAIIQSLHHIKRYFGDELDAAYTGQNLPDDRKQILGLKYRRLTMN